jgi:hypothetical protein
MWLFMPLNAPPKSVFGGKELKACDDLVMEVPGLVLIGLRSLRPLKFTINGNGNYRVLGLARAWISGVIASSS